MSRAMRGLLVLACFCSTKFVDSHPGTHLQDFNLSTTNLNDSVQIDHVSTINKKHFYSYFAPFDRPLRAFANCTAASDDESDFPHFLTEDQVRKGGIVLVILVGLYGFTLLAVVCNDYFLPCVETICEKVNLTPDVAAATFMSIATSTPEFFTNIIGTFVTESDLGIGTIVGSSMYNALGVPAIGGLNAPFPLQLDWYALTRDCIIYMSSVSVLITISWDGYIYWYETVVSLGIYVLYFIIMFNNKRIARFVRKLGNKNKLDVTPPKTESPKSSIPPEVAPSKYSSKDADDNKKTSEMSEDAPKPSIMSAYGSYLEEVHKPSYEIEHRKVLETILDEDRKEAQKSLFRKPEGTIFQKIWFYYAWPMKLIFRFTVPNPKIYPNWYPLTFIMCIFYIGINSYIISWMMSIIGTITKLPDALLGMTIMAIGGCLPETVSMTIIARRGEGAFGVSNTLGANTMNVLYSLGLPWLFKNIGNIYADKGPVVIQSGSLEYTIMSLLAAVTVLYLTLLLSKFRLSKISGSILLVLYLSFVVLAILTQTVFFKVVNC